jgi:hypothetical protein
MIFQAFTYEIEEKLRKIKLVPRSVMGELDLHNEISKKRFCQKWLNHF